MSSLFGGGETPAVPAPVAPPVAADTKKKRVDTVMRSANKGLGQTILTSQQGDENERARKKLGAGIG